MQLSFANKVALVVGAADAVGSAIALSLAAKGAAVALLDKDEARLAALASDITKAGAKALAVPLDPTGHTAAAQAVSRITLMLGPIDVLINNTPDPTPHPLGALSGEGFNAAVTGTVGVQFAFMRQIVPAMRERKQGRVVNLSSLSYLGLSGAADVAAAQSAVFGLTRSVALEAARDKVTINTVVKGDLARPDQSEEDIAKATGPIPAKRLGHAADIAYAVSFLASDAAQYVTGQTMFVCGGRSAYFSMSV
jgi:3-oxoacyl-[acyl-carrier protein] reductase/2-[hydroxy(phenyl)methyl]-succinyl-CoA dehydrogenase BbsC subunit